MISVESVFADDWRDEQKETREEINSQLDGSLFGCTFPFQHLFLFKYSLYINLLSPLPLSCELHEDSAALVLFTAMSSVPGSEPGP